MSATVHKIPKRTYVGNPDGLLHDCIGEFAQVIVIGVDHDGDFNFIPSTDEARDLVYMVDCAKHALMMGVFSE